MCVCKQLPDFIVSNTRGASARFSDLRVTNSQLIYRSVQ